MAQEHDTDVRRRRIAAAGLVAAAALLVPLVALAAGRGHRALSAAAGVPNFAREVAPIVRQKCAGCHQLGGIAPFAFTSERDVASRAALVVEALQDRRMPPWPPGPTSPAYLGQGGRTLTARQRDTLLRWARAELVRPGAPRAGAQIGKAPATIEGARPGESLVDLRMPSAYRPRSVAGATDDYRCFLLDPKLTGSSFVTSARIEPGVSSLVHHVILFRIVPGGVADAERLDSEAPGLGWPCFGGTGVRQPAGIGGNAAKLLDNAGWITAWAPGWGGAHLRRGTGIELPAGSQIVMQVHYNLLHRIAPDRSRAVLTTVPGSTQLAPVETMLLPAPVELPCAKGETGRLCDRTAALADEVRKYGSTTGLIPVGLLLLCGKDAAKPPAGPVTTCDRTLERATTIQAVAGHMHLLGTAIKVELNPGAPSAKVLLEIPRWDFHWQAVYTLETPIEAQPGDVVRVTCRHDASKRAGSQPRYTLWGEGTTDEMCLGILQVTR